MRPLQPFPVALSLLLITALACNNGEKAAKSRADSLEAILRFQQDSMHSAVLKRQQDSASAARQRIDDSIRAEHDRPRTLTLFNSTGVTVSASTFKEFGFELPAAGDCKVKGRIEATAGGNKDVAVLLLTDDDFLNWKNNPQTKAADRLLSEGPQTVTALDVALPRPGKYHFVISNRAAVFLGKTVQGQVAVTCTGGVEPRPLP